MSSPLGDSKRGETRSAPVVCTLRMWIFLPFEEPRPMEAIDRTVNCA
jgi:hypothetical protein